MVDMESIFQLLDTKCHDKTQLRKMVFHYKLLPVNLDILRLKFLPPFEGKGRVCSIVPSHLPYMPNDLGTKLPLTWVLLEFLRFKFSIQLTMGLEKSLGAEELSPVSSYFVVK